MDLASYPGLQIAGGRPGIHCLRMRLSEYYVIFNCDVCEWVGLRDPLCSPRARFMPDDVI